jgi:hypothetical protein
MITMEEWSRKESKEQTLQLAQSFVVALKAGHPPNLQKN